MGKPGCLGDKMKRNELGQLVRADGKVDLRSLRPRDTINTSGLRPGGDAVKQTIMQRYRDKEARAERLKEPDGLKDLLREIAADVDQTASYRVSAVNALAALDEDAKKGGLCWKCKQMDTSDVPKSVQEWIDNLPAT